ncbi:hypothetical protein A3K86_00020 [Photobacterium jeanii]|uniref:Uncharacterized protein n=1 Tax=Photobacterium jeanii TaxID=858640 RepID=A0A178KR89_9GAMM|nr:hypothetical protein [Photobacterium jeanii]OAN19958.1 hypothetical protein A3K86_00020 [Photobacterium jeanii]PST85798.1 hypothetical protein C9I91_22410 [Photobacterium jeanii]
MVRVPFRWISLNNEISVEDKNIFTVFEKEKSYHSIIEQIPSLQQERQPIAFKKISKAIYLHGANPPISKQGHDTKQVLGATGEALTELILNHDKVKVNNPGYDLSVSGSLLEVKSTVEDSVSMSDIQFQTANYLIIHIYHKYKDTYQNCYLIPMKILREIKGQNRKSGRRVTVNIYKEKWVELFKLTPIRVAQYFKVRNLYINEQASSIVQVRSRGELDKKIQNSSVHVKDIFEMYSKFNSWRWEMHFAYYEYFYKGTITWLYTYRSLDDVNN